MYAIEKNVPIPRKLKTGPKSKYPFADMDVGDSFLVTGVTREAATTAAAYGGKKFEGKFLCRPDGDGFRIWRVE